MPIEKKNNNLSLSLCESMKRASQMDWVCPEQKAGKAVMNK